MSNRDYPNRSAWIATNPLLAPYEYPGKFEGELKLAKVLWDGDGPDDAIEEVGEGNGYYGLYLDLDKDSELGDLGDIRAAILFEDSQGFVSATYYNTSKAAREQFDLIAACIEEEEAEGAED